VAQKKRPGREPVKLAGGGSGADPNHPAAKLAARAGSQAEAFRVMQENSITFLLGPAGTGKSYSATQFAWRMLSTNQAQRVVVTRPAVSCGGEQLGYLPGELNSKMHVWLLPFQDVLRNIVGEVAEKTLACFEVLPLAYCRGRTLDNCVAILDECQNATLTQLRAYLTRVGHGGKLLIVGDPGQSDLAGGGQHLNILADEMEKRGLAGVVRFPASAVVRHPLIQGIERLFEDMRAKK
jgi:phosphate starvation-inducible PhoH-like protein